MTGLYENQRQVETQVYMNTDRKTINIDSVLLFLLSLAPILQHYQGVFINPSLAITSFFAIIALIRLFQRKIKINVGFLFLLAYGLYASFVHGVNSTYLLREMVQIVVYLAVINEFFDIKKLLKYYRSIAIAATILLLIQYLCYYLLGFHLQLVPISLLKPGTSQWFGLIRTGRIGVTGTRLAFYRPSAFFLEPSHFAVYCIPVIVTTLFSRTGDEKRERQIALFISTGVLLSTSGMGIGVVIICWAFYLLFIFGRKGENRKLSFRKLLNKRSLTFFIFLLVLLAVLYGSIPFFRQSLDRIFFSSGDESMTAIEGRTSTGRRSLEMLEGIRKWIGFGDIYDISDWNMSAFYFVTFRFGWIGTVIFYSFYLYSLFHLKREARAMTVAFLILSFFTVHMFGAYYKMYYTMIILYGYVQCRQEEEKMMTDSG